MRKPLFILISLAFTGGLLLYTAQANLDLLTSVYPNPRFVIFGMLALEGGVIYWIGVYLIHWNDTQRAIAVFMIALDALLSLTGFFVEVSEHNASNIFIGQLPAVVILVAMDAALNVAMGLIVHLLPDHRPITREDLPPFLLDGPKKILDAVKKRPIKSREGDQGDD